MDKGSATHDGESVEILYALSRAASSGSKFSLPMLWACSGVLEGLCDEGFASCYASRGSLNMIVSAWLSVDVRGGSLI